MTRASFLRSLLTSLIGLLLIAALAAIAWHGWATRPHVPLDMSPNDPETRAIYETTWVRHVLVHLAAAVVALILGRLLHVALRRSFRASDLARLRVPAEGEVMRGPKRILLFRHAEKTGEEDDIHLSKPGFARSKRLATYLPETFGAPTAIFAAPKTRRSVRSMQTVAPLGMAAGLPVISNLEDRDFPALVRRLFTEPDYDEGLIVLCWHHSRIPDMARMLGAPAGSYPDPWPYELYDVIVDITYDADGTCKAEHVTMPF